MWFEAKNRNGLYPFDISVEDPALTSSAIQVANSIRNMKLFIVSDCPLTAYLTLIDSEQLFIDIYLDNLLFRCSCTFKGLISGSALLDTRNSYILLCDIPTEGQYHLKLLPLVLCYIPRGLQLYCKSNLISKIAATYTCLPGDGYLFDKTVRFTDGKNCHVFSLLDNVTFIGGAGNGSGKFTLIEVNKLWGYAPSGAELDTKPSRGLLSINGQSPGVNLQCSPGLDISFKYGRDTKGDILIIGIGLNKRGDEDEASKT